MPNNDEGPAVGPFIAAIGECMSVIELLKERLDDHLGVSPDLVTWGHVGNAERLLELLRRAAFNAGVGSIPPI